MSVMGPTTVGSPMALRSRATDVSGGEACWWSQASTAASNGRGWRSPMKYAKARKTRVETATTIQTAAPVRAAVRSPARATGGRLLGDIAADEQEGGDEAEEEHPGERNGQGMR